MLKIKGSSDTDYSSHNIVNPSNEHRQPALDRIIADVKQRGYELTGMDYAEIETDSGRTFTSPVILVANNATAQNGVITRREHKILGTSYRLYMIEDMRDDNPER